LSIQSTAFGDDEPLIVRPARAFALLGIGKTLGFALIRARVLEKRQLGPRAVGITMRSIRRVASEGVDLATSNTPRQRHPTSAAK
jgi:hypothetical protein